MSSVPLITAKRSGGTRPARRSPWSRWPIGKLIKSAKTRVANNRKCAALCALSATLLYYYHYYHHHLLHQLNTTNQATSLVVAPLQGPSKPSSIKLVNNYLPQHTQAHDDGHELVSPSSELISEGNSGKRRVRFYEPQQTFSARQLDQWQAPVFDGGELDTESSSDVDRLNASFARQMASVNYLIEPDVTKTLINCTAKNMDKQKAPMATPDSQQQKQIDLVIVINSRWSNYARREHLRASWLQRDALEQQTCGATNVLQMRSVRHLFVLGTPSERELGGELGDHEQQIRWCELRMGELRAEAERYGDILLVNKVDTYRSMTYKHLATFKWLLTTTTSGVQSGQDARGASMCASEYLSEEEEGEEQQQRKVNDGWGAGVATRLPQQRAAGQGRPWPASGHGVHGRARRRASSEHAGINLPLDTGASSGTLAPALATLSTNSRRHQQPQPLDKHYYYYYYYHHHYRGRRHDNNNQQDASTRSLGPPETKTAPRSQTFSMSKHDQPRHQQDEGLVNNNINSNENHYFVDQDREQWQSRQEQQQNNNRTSVGQDPNWQDRNHGHSRLVGEQRRAGRSRAKGPNDADDRVAPRGASGQPARPDSAPPHESSAAPAEYVTARGHQQQPRQKPHSAKSHEAVDNVDRREQQDSEGGSTSERLARVVVLKCDDDAQVRIADLLAVARGERVLERPAARATSAAVMDHNERRRALGEAARTDARPVQASEAPASSAAAGSELDKFGNWIMCAEFGAHSRVWRVAHPTAGHALTSSGTSGAAYGRSATSGARPNFQVLNQAKLRRLDLAAPASARAAAGSSANQQEHYNDYEDDNNNGLGAGHQVGKQSGARRGQVDNGGGEWRENKWRLTRAEWPHDTFPAYCSGLAYVTSMRLVRRLYAAAHLLLAARPLVATSADTSAASAHAHAHAQASASRACHQVDTHANSAASSGQRPADSGGTLWRAAEPLWVDDVYVTGVLRGAVRAPPVKTIQLNSVFCYTAAQRAARAAYGVPCSVSELAAPS